MNKMELRDIIEDNLSKMYGVALADANIEQLYKASAVTINDILRKKRKVYNNIVKENQGKRVYYLCMEFLMGRSFKNNLYNLGLVNEFSSILESIGFTLEDLYEHEPDAGLGNGGLGRLGACYLDALASQAYPAMGFSIRYEYGLFKQKIVNGWQTELPDVWLPGGEVWLTLRGDKVYQVKFNGEVIEKHVGDKIIYDYLNYKAIEAVPYDMMVSGANSEAISVLRLWRSRNIQDFNLKLFSQGDYMEAMKEYNEADLISKVLYPSDDHYEGKALRVKQQYFLVSASMQNIIADHLRYYGDIHSLPKYVAIHINDTHPALCIPELMRILIDEYDLSFEESWGIVQTTISYTNHTVMAEALEKWSEELIQKLLPRIYIILKQINNLFVKTCEKWQLSEQQIANLAIIHQGQIRMANLSVIASHKVNGVSKLHSDIIKNDLFKGFAQIWPEKFTNVTNGIAYRRWLYQANPKLVELLDRTIGKGYLTDASELRQLLTFKEDDETLKQLELIKNYNKVEFAKYLFKQTGININPKTRFDVQIKRLHEYKRQLLNALKIVALLIELEENPHADVTPQTYIFGAKAAPGYFVAKEIIELICAISQDINKNQLIREKLNVVFVENYNVTMAEKIIPASDISEQISLAGKEASGTGNMKFMINGALTFGTFDGANVEITEAVGKDNIFLFGMSAEEVNNLWKKGYNPSMYYENNPLIKKVINRLNRGFNGKTFDNITRYLLNNFPVSDPYMCLADFDSYMKEYHYLDQVYKNRRLWQQMALVNIANAGIFSADRSIDEYVKNIWHLRSFKK
ncbi:MAG: glycogen/starch/alpha-glucan phosphorylase [Bacilli bacterium]